MADVSSSMYQSFLDQVKDFKPTVEAVEVGYVEEVGGGIPRGAGLQKIRGSEVGRFP